MPIRDSNLTTRPYTRADQTLVAALRADQYRRWHAGDPRLSYPPQARRAADRSLEEDAHLGETWAVVAERAQPGAAPRIVGYLRAWWRRFGDRDAQLMWLPQRHLTCEVFFQFAAAAAEEPGAVFTQLFAAVQALTPAPPSEPWAVSLVPPGAGLDSALTALGFRVTSVFAYRPGGTTPPPPPTPPLKGEGSMTTPPPTPPLKGEGSIAPPFLRREGGDGQTPVELRTQNSELRTGVGGLGLSPPGWTIRPATRADKPAIVGLYADLCAYHSGNDPYADRPPPRLREDFGYVISSVLAEPRRWALLVAHHTDSPTLRAFTLASVDRDEGGPAALTQLPPGTVGFIHDFMIAEGVRRQGLGRALWAATVAACASRAPRPPARGAMHGTWLVYRPSNPTGAHFWPALGYTPLYTMWRRGGWTADPADMV